MLARLVDLVALLSVGDDPDCPAVRQHAFAPGRESDWPKRRADCCCTMLDVNGEQVTRYRIVAPTEWNFHPDGALARGLRERPVDGPETARREAHVLVQALDPCVACPSRSPMHEMSLAEGILQIVEDTARANAAARVRSVLLEIGALSHVEEQALRFCLMG